MNHQAFQQLLFAPLWSKEVVVWVGQSDPLDELLSGLDRRDLDLLDLLPEDEALPSGLEDRGDLLRRELNRYLQINRSDESSRVVLVVHNTAILARYGVGLQPFYDWFAGARTMTVLDLGRLRHIQLPTALACSVTMESSWLADYFRSALRKPDYLCGRLMDA